VPRVEKSSLPNVRVKSQEDGPEVRIDSTLMSDFSNTLRPSNRMQHSAEFDLVFKTPEAKVHHQYFLVLGRSKKSDADQLGLVVGKKNIPKAVQRNRFKRIARESHRLQMVRNCDIVILAKKVSPRVTNQELRTAFDTALTSLKKKINEPAHG